MMHPFSELVIGGVLVAPFITHVMAALVIMLLLRPVLHLCRFATLFSHPPIAELSLFVVLLGLLTVVL